MFFKKIYVHLKVVNKMKNIFKNAGVKYTCFLFFLKAYT